MQNLLAISLVGMSTLTMAISALSMFSSAQKTPKEPEWIYKYRAEIVRVIDGDTVECKVDLGFDVSLNAKFRMSGIDSPEIDTEAGKVTAARLRDLCPVGLKCVVQTRKDRKEKYGRYLAVIIKDGVNINQLLLDEGLAKKYGKMVD